MIGLTATTRSPIRTRIRIYISNFARSASSSTSAANRGSAKTITMAPPKSALEFLDFVNASPTRTLPSSFLPGYYFAAVVGAGLGWATGYYVYAEPQ